jgi:hypothetical protein
VQKIPPEPNANVVIKGAVKKQHLSTGVNGRELGMGNWELGIGDWGISGFCEGNGIWDFGLGF